MDDPPPIQWYYADAGERHGPISPSEWESLVATGTITESTLVWHDGMDEWKPWAALNPAADSPPKLADTALPPTGFVRCSECGQTYPEQDTIAHGLRRICAACKPRFLQRLMEGAELGRMDGRHLSLEEIAERDYPLGIGRAWNRAWEVFQVEPWRLMAVVLCFMLIMAASGAVGLVIPFASNAIGLFITSQLTAGLYLVFLLCLRGEPVQFHAAYRGFGPRYWQLTLCQLIQSAIMLAFGLLLFAGLAPALFIGIGASTGNFQPPLWAVIVLFGLGTIISLVAIVFLFYFLISWMFAAPLILDKGLDVWPAMKLSRKLVNRHPWRFSWAILVITTFGGLGLVLCGVGVIVTGTLSGLMLAAVYEDMVGDLDPQPPG